MNGIIIVDKPAGWTSHDVVAKLRGVLRERRAGHGGTLDPMATGVLPVFFGRATRAVQFCENAEKEYMAGLRLGLVTDTQDITGNILSSGRNTASKEELIKILGGFTGRQKQTPPMYSAVKLGGRKLYELARQGVEVERPAREIIIRGIELLKAEENEFLLKIVCSKGTYIRTLCHDIGARLGCGGVMSSLRRTRAGVFDIGSAHTLDEISQAAVSGILEGVVNRVDTLFSKYPSITLNARNAEKCKNGAQFHVGDISDGLYRVYGPGGGFMMLGEAKAGTLITVKSFFEV